ncbi:hypothetical protein [Campylobacter sp. MG1]|uniref:hypothetical protein n=1 Tax=Campylobacter sp. MG1 TaxID=2976332 RepID=UPI00226CCC58|nr:hypothetical protein [Campylobacter sp. MG1]
MKILCCLFFAFSVFAYTLDYPGDTPPLDASPNWQDPTIPDDLDNTNVEKPNEIDEFGKMFNELDEKKQKKLKKFFKFLLEDDEEEKVIEEPIPEVVEKKKGDGIDIKVYENGKPYKAKSNNKKNGNIQININ